MCKIYRFIVIFLWMLTILESRANHILGGNFEMINTGTVGYYQLNLKLFFDLARRRVSPTDDNNLRIAIYRKSDNKQMRLLTLNSSNLTGNPFVYTNENCAATQGLKVTTLEFSQNIYLDPAEYNDPSGYYIVWDRCCRNSADNIANSLSSGMLFYLEFPALKDAAGQEFKNSSPKFTVPNGEYICKGQPFKFDNGATDEDGDQLRYSLVTPYSGFSNGTTPIPNPRPSSNYPTINWISGYSATTAIPSTPVMAIDDKGQITVTSNQLGLYVFSVLVEELRNGVVIGQVRRDFQLKVIDCEQPPAKPTVFKDASPTTTQVAQLDICEYGFVEIATKYDANFQYQWQKNDDNIPAAEGYKLKVTEAGDYTVVISYKTGCSGSSKSEKTKVTVKPGDNFQVNPPNPEVCDNPNGVALNIEKVGGGTFDAGNYQYLWVRNQTDTITVRNVFIQAKKTGKYAVRMNQISGSARCQYELEANVTINPLPEAVLTNTSGVKVICEGDSIMLKVSQDVNNTYDWQRDGISVRKGSSENYGVSTIGTHIYRVEVTDGKGCKKMSDTLKLKVNPQTPVRFDSISPQCGTGGNRIDLKPYVSPYDAVNGAFSGRGIDGTIYSPLLAGYGPSPILYTYTNNLGCVTKASRIAFVDLTPKIQLGNDITIFRGDTVRLKSTVSGSFTNNLQLQWSPTTGLDNPSIGRPLASPNDTQKYVLSATAPLSGCKNQDTIVVFVKTRIIIPQGFTPNDDRVNDAWVLEGIEDYPDSEVSIFNRWGAEIFSTKNYQNNPFNGKKGNDFLPMGTYFYVIKTGDTVPTQTGYLTLVRGGQ
jgi:gliding motility-associated-like protein